MKVNNLTIEGEKRVWDANKIQSLFNAETAKAILAVPIFHELHEDNLIWKDGRDGMYSVKTGYSKEDSNMAGRVAMHIWCLWQNRNDKVWNDHAINALQIGQQSFNSWQAWLEAREMQPDSSNPSLVQHDRQFILAQTSWQQSKLSVIEGEGVTLLEAIKRAEQRGFDRVVFESGSQTLETSKFGRSHSCEVARTANSWTRHQIFENAPPCIELILFYRSTGPSIKVF
ncbi:hypothetical protein L195_g003952 [Trifolium pratense]|uniref:Uncharacterized protein n=1 Tax=Trifolium pratense TaxID=57577 RepID=A0A2K3NWN7_TRIPR|nr:hypothetical protein L195_g003952 [Trifolium pratense]